MLSLEVIRQHRIEVLEDDPCPSYKGDGEKESGMLLSDYEIFFKVSSGVLTVTRVECKCHPV